jgi:hypothetical protein
MKKAMTKLSLMQVQWKTKRLRVHVAPTGAPDAEEEEQRVEDDSDNDWAEYFHGR